MTHDATPDRGPVLLLGTSFRAGPWACRSLDRAGWVVRGLEETSPPTGRHPACRCPLRCPSPAREREAFIRRLEAVCRALRPAALLSTDEDMTRVVALDAPDLAGAVHAGPTAAQYAALCDKVMLHHTTDAAGVGHAPFAVVAASDHMPPMPDLPCVVKPRFSGEGADIAAVRVTDEHTRRAAVAHLLDAGNEAVVEGWVTGRQVSVYAVRDMHGTVRSMSARVVRRHPRVVGTPSLMVTAPEPECLRAVARVLDAVDYCGPVNAQFLVPDHGEPVLHDVNLRLGAGVAMAMHAGLDVPLLAVRAALGVPLPAVDVCAGLVYVNSGAELPELRHTSPGGVVRTARWAGAAVRGRGLVLDPHPWDPWFIAASARERARRTARRVARRSG